MSEKTTHFVGIIMNGVTGRMGLNQHLRRSIYAIIKQGGVRISPSEIIVPEPILLGRNAIKLAEISKECGSRRLLHQPRRSGLADPANQSLFRFRS